MADCCLQNEYPYSQDSNLPHNIQSAHFSLISSIITIISIKFESN